VRTSGIEQRLEVAVGAWEGDGMDAGYTHWVVITVQNQTARRSIALAQAPSKKKKVCQTHIPKNHELITRSKLSFDVARPRH
jgi:hypothetical protein